jgi:hypothetical protein
MVEIIVLSVLLTLGSANQSPLPESVTEPIAKPVAVARCTGSASCRACKNCRYCKHCAKQGGTCGVCKPKKNKGEVGHSHAKR